MFERLFPTPIDEKRLIENAKTNHHDFARLYDRFVGVVYRFVKRHVVNEQDAEDIVSETCMAVALQIKKYDTTKEQKFTTWVLGIAKHKLADHWRQIYQTPETSRDNTHEPSYEGDMLQLLTNQTNYQKILACVQTLWEKQWSIFSLRYIEELTNKEIAQLYEIDEKTVSSTLSMVCKKIKTHCSIEWETYAW